MSTPGPQMITVRPGDLMQVGDDVRMAFTIAEAALEIADQSGASPVEVARLRGMMARLTGRTVSR